MCSVDTRGRVAAVLEHRLPDRLGANLAVYNALLACARVECTENEASPSGSPSWVERARLVVDGELSLAEQGGISALPPLLSVRGGLDLSNCTALSRLPAGLRCSAWVNLNGCTSLESLPACLVARDWISLARCSSLSSLPANLRVGTWLNLYKCVSLRALPQGMRVGGSLDAEKCSALVEIPADVNIGGWCDLSGSTALVAFPAVSVNGRISLSGCSRLESLPEGLRVRGGLSLVGCTSLVRLPRGLHVNGRLDLSGCAALRALPADLRARTLYLRGCLLLPALPHGLPDSCLVRNGVRCPDGHAETSELWTDQALLNVHVHRNVPRLCRAWADRVAGLATLHASPVLHVVARSAALAFCGEAFEDAQWTPGTKALGLARVVPLAERLIARRLAAIVREHAAFNSDSPVPIDLSRGGPLVEHEELDEELEGDRSESDEEATSDDDEAA
jgi:hypothetical protein